MDERIAELAAGKPKRSDSVEVWEAYRDRVRKLAAEASDGDIAYKEYVASRRAYRFYPLRYEEWSPRFRFAMTAPEPR